MEQVRLSQRSMLRRNWTQAGSMFGNGRDKVLDVSVGVLLCALPWVWMVRKQDSWIHDSGVNPEALCLSRICSNRFFSFDVFLSQQFHSLSPKPKRTEYHRLQSRCALIEAQMKSHIDRDLQLESSVNPGTETGSVENCCSWVLMIANCIQSGL